MSDVLSDVNMYLSEPDETVLTAALRNKDDIPILMDIVGDEATPVSQEEYLQSSVGIDPEIRPVTAASSGLTKKKAVHAPVMSAASKSDEVHAKRSATPYSEPPAQINSTDEAQTPQYPTASSSEAATSAFHEDEHAAMLADVIQTVLARKLPEIVNDVMLEIAKREQQ